MKLIDDFYDRIMRVKNWIKTHPHLSVVIFILLIIGLMGTYVDSLKQKNQNLSANADIKVEDKNVKEKNNFTQNLRQLSYENSKTNENYFYLVLQEDKSKEALLDLAKKITAEICKKPCNINFYDEEKAYNLDKEREKIAYTDFIPDFNARQAKLNEWDKENIPYLADHVLGFMLFDGDYFSYKPYKEELERLDE